MIILLLVLAGQAQPPPELLAAQNARSFLSGQIEYAIDFQRPGSSQHQRGSFRFYDQNHLSTHFIQGDDATSLEDFDPGMHTAMIDGQYVWTSGNAMLAVIRPDPPKDRLRFVDPRAFGLTPLLSDAWNRTYEDAIWQTKAAGAGAAEYEVTSENQYKVVTRRAGDNELKWWIDPARGWNIVRTRSSFDGKVSNEVRIALRQYGERWAPTEFAYYAHHFKDAREPECLVTFSHASFDDADAKPLTLEDVGLDVGTNITIAGQDGKPEVDPKTGKTKMYTWNGAAIEDYWSVMRRVNSGEMRIGARFAEALENRQMLNAARAARQPENKRSQWHVHYRFADPSFWRQYTQGFIDRHNLDEAQQQRAWLVCEGCEAQAKRYLERNAEKIEKAERLKREALSSTDGGMDKQEAIQRFVDRKSELLAPLERIFETRLKPGLDKLLTRHQRRRSATPGDEP